MPPNEQLILFADNNDIGVVHHKVLPFLRQLGFLYTATGVRADLNGRVIETDAVIYLDEEQTKPFIVVEIKRAIRSELSLLDPVVQQAFTAATAFGPQVRYLLITDGTKFVWFERSLDNQSISLVTIPPENIAKVKPPFHGEALIPVASPEQYQSLLQLVVEVLRREGLAFSIRMAIELNRILIAKLFDEVAGTDSGIFKFNSHSGNILQVAETVKALYEAAINRWSGDASRDGIWSLSPQALFSVVQLLEPYALGTVSTTTIERSFWQTFTALIRREEGQYTTPLPLAQLVVELAQPVASERILDPTCGTGLFLLEVARKIRAKATLDFPKDDVDYFLAQNIRGVEINSEVAELAATNFIINKLPYSNVLNADALDTSSLATKGIYPESFDLVITNPPFGLKVKDNFPYFGTFELSRLASRTYSETLFLEQALHLLRPNGRLVILLPDAFLSSPSLVQARKWLLQNTVVKAIVGLPADTFAPLGHSGRASILLLEKTRDRNDQAPVLIADVRHVGYDRSGQTTRENDIPDLIEVFVQFQESGIINSRLENERLRIWTVPLGQLSSELSRLDVLQLDPVGLQLENALKHAQYPSARLEQVADIVSGRNFKNYVELGPRTALVIQAGAVRDLEILETTTPRISMEDYYSAGRVQLRLGDVLVTTTGQYLGRAAVVERLSEPSVASGALTILRPKNGVDPYFLASVISSEIGKEQIYKRQAAATAQPYIRRADLGNVLIPLPELSFQRELAQRITSLILQAKELHTKATELEVGARELFINTLLRNLGDE